MAEALKEAGVETTYSCYPGMIHLFYGMGGVPYLSNIFSPFFLGFYKKPLSFQIQKA